MEQVEALLSRARSYAKRTGLTKTTISRKLLGNGKRLGELEAGKSLRVDTLQRANELLDQLEADAA